MVAFKENNKAIYLQIADKICDDILAGVFTPGARIPSVRDYAASIEVNANTVMRSYEYLERLGIVFNRRGIGFFVADSAFETVVGIRRETFINGELQSVFRQLMLMGIPSEELKNMYNKYLNDVVK